MNARSPCLVADIGGTHARFALTTDFRTFSDVQVLPCAGHPRFEDALAAYLDMAGTRVSHGAVAIATPVLGDRVSMTNFHWSFSVEETRRQLGLDTLLLVNDFSALALALPWLGRGDLRRLDENGIERTGVKAVIGPGTGLGVAGLVPVAGGWQAMATEGGHVDFAPANEIEMDMLRLLWRDYPHVSAERLVSGPGIALIYRSLCHLAGVVPRAAEAREIAALAAAGECPVAGQTLSTFSAILGAVAGDLALSYGALGGVYLGGGILGRLGAQFDLPAYRQRFLAKGRFRAYLEAIPNHLITADNPAFLGVAQHLRQHLGRDE